MDADKLFTETETRHEQLADHLRDTARLFHEHEGELFTRPEAIDLLTEECELVEDTAQQALSQLVGDGVDPVIQVTNDGTRYIGVAEFHTFNGAYGYVDFHDLYGEDKHVVCQQCVNSAAVDSAVTHATEHDLTDGADTDVEWSELVESVHAHYDQSHTAAPPDVGTSVEATGATLKSGTTIAGNKAFHAGNDGPDSGLDADSVDGQELAGLVTKNAGPEVDVYASKSAVPNTISEGEIVYISDESALYVEDGT